MSQYLVPLYSAALIQKAVYTIIIIICLIALVYDLKWRIIPNWLTYGGCFIGVLLNAVLAPTNGLLASIFGALLALIFFLPMFYMGGFGGGDVKLMTALGALAGLQLSANILLLTTLAGGLLAIVQVTRKGSWRNMFRRLGLLLKLKYHDLENDPPEQQLSLPYGLAITIGSIGAVILNYLNKPLFHL